ncbi:MAG: hypothetical protein NUV75_09950 [Gallionella sp.]|nr:hypothetical protein [Gallionella sp.]
MSSSLPNNLFKNPPILIPSTVPSHCPKIAAPTPYEKLKSLPLSKQYLKRDITFQQLDAQAREISDNEAAQRLNDARAILFKAILPTNGCLKTLKNAPLQTRTSIEMYCCVALYLKTVL